MKRLNSTLLVIIPLITLLGSNAALAGTLNAVLSGKSYHLNAAHDWNENNFGLGLEYEREINPRWRTSMFANGLNDSTDSMSYMVGAGLHRQLFTTDRFSGFYVSAGLNAFLMTREDVNNNNPFPGLLPSVSVGNDKVGFNLTYLPRQAVQSTSNATFVDPDITGIVFIQFKMRMDQVLPR